MDKIEYAIQKYRVTPSGKRIPIGKLEVAEELQLLRQLMADNPEGVIANLKEMYAERHGWDSKEITIFVHVDAFDIPDDLDELTADELVSGNRNSTDLKQEEDDDEGLS